MTPLTERILEIIKAIPMGKVTSYGQVAALAGSPRGARQVVRILHSMSDAHELPWHRVVAKDGRISIPAADSQAIQITLLESEGVPVVFERVDMMVYGWP